MYELLMGEVRELYAKREEEFGAEEEDDEARKRIGVR